MTFAGFLLRAVLAGLLALAVPAVAKAGEPPPGPPMAAMDLASLPNGGDWVPRLHIASRVDPALSPMEVMAQADSLGFRRVAPGETPQFQSRDGDIWLRFSLANSSDESRSAKFSLRFPYLEHVHMFERRADGRLVQSAAGASQRLKGRAVSAAYPAFDLEVPPGAVQEYFVRIRSSTIIMLPANLASDSAFTHAITSGTLIWSLIAGAAFAFAIYAASMSFSGGSGAFRMYVWFALSAAFYIILSSGLLTTLMSGRVDFNFGRMVYFAQALALAFGAIFIITFLDMQTTAPGWYRLFYGIAGLGLLTGVGFLLPLEVARVLFFIATGLGPLVLAAGLVWMSVTGIRGARNVLIAWLPCLLATVWIYLRVVEVTPYLPINHFLLPLAMAFTLAYLSALLGGQVRETEIWANSDPMTGLGNRRLLERIKELESRQPGERYCAAVAIDLDNFKPINDTYGHAAGDAVLLMVAERLRTHFAGRGDIFRLGGDEFLLLGYQWVTRMDILTQTNSFLLSLKQAMVHEGQHLTIGASAGIAFHDPRAGFSNMLKQADAELYRVKESGGGSMRIADQRKRDRRRSEPVTPAVNDTVEIETDNSIVTPFTALR